MCDISNPRLLPETWCGCDGEFETVQAEVESHAQHERCRCMIDDDVAERIAPRSVTYDVKLLIEKCEQKEIMHPALEIITAFGTDTNYFDCRPLHPL
jgi:hypothetical protein